MADNIKFSMAKLTLALSMQSVTKDTQPSLILLELLLPWLPEGFASARRTRRLTEISTPRKKATGQPCSTRANHPTMQALTEFHTGTQP
eukprot:2890493-Amphidinium_carterae.1